VRKSDTDLLNRLNGALRKLIADGTYHKIAAKYVSFDPLKD
ncbi:transporter substrate-binding domain-containing protein, partial [Mesorhizobium sp. M7D.F.Ca.US.004.03.1.1]